MATLTFNGESFTVDHAAKGADYIHGYDANGVLIVSFDGVTDFSGFTYDGTYMNPGDCMGESCNVVRRVGGKLVNSDGANVPVGALGAGTFAGQVVANSGGQAVGTSLLRNSKLVSADTNPTVNGEICWTYK